jgi:hypothetical protein
VRGIPLRGNVMRRTRLIPIVALILTAGLSWSADYSRYHNYQELTASLQELAATHPGLARLFEVAKTREGRVVWGVEIANREGVPLESRPGILVVANLEGDQLCGSEIALFTVEHLLKNAATNQDVKQRLETSVFYIIPRFNPDGAEYMFQAIKTGRKTNTSAFDDDNDRRVDEDGPEDLNKDGFITVMRVKDPRGEYMIHPDEPRLLRRASPQKGETGVYKVYWEGIDNDGDGFINEDPPGGVDLNRNFQHKYPYYAPDAGRYMVSENETRGMMDFIDRHRNIGAILTFGESDNLISTGARRTDATASTEIDMLAFAAGSTAPSRRVGMAPDPGGMGGFRGRFFGGGFDDDEMPPGGQRQAAAAGGRPQMPARRPVETVNTDDAEYFRTVGEKYRALTGLRSTPSVRTAAGAFFEYGYYQFGVPSFSTPGWGLPAARGGGPPASTEDRPPQTASGPPSTGGNLPQGGFAGGGFGGGRAFQGGGAAQGAGGAPGEARIPEGTAAFDLRLLRWMDAEKIDGFAPWTPFKHPTLGDVEIGGFKPYALSNPPASAIADLGKTHAEFVVYLGSIFPHITIADASVKALGSKLYRITAEVANTGYLPTALAQGVASRSVRPVMVQLGVDPKDIVSGNEKTNFIPTLAGSGRRQKFEWVVRGTPGATVTLKAVAQKGGTDTKTLALK